MSPLRTPVNPLLTSDVLERLLSARREGAATAECSLDLGRTAAVVDVQADHWAWHGQRFPYPERCKDRTVYHWSDGAFCAVARYGSSLIKLVPTPWGPPTFEIDGIKMLPTAQVSPYADAGRKVRLIEPRGKLILDTCGGLGYFAAWCLETGASHVISYEKNPDVVWLRGLNPWSPPASPRLTLTVADVEAAICELPDASADAALHDPPRFGIAGELYALRFYRELARVLRRRGRLFHYTGSPNKLTTGRNLSAEVAGRLVTAGFTVQKDGDGLVAVKR